MYIILKQLDITLNQSYNPYYSDYMDDEYSHEFIKHIYKKIDRRLNQLDNLKKLINEELSDEDFYKLVLETYYLTYKNKTAIKTNIILGTKYDYLMLNIRVNTNIDIDYDKVYSMDELESMFKNEEIIYETEFISEDNDIKDTTNYKVCSDQEFSYYFNRIKSLENIFSNKNVSEVREILTKDRIKRDYDRLLKQTESELGYLSRKYGENDYFKL